jgi:HD superfamily phosphodiesterase
MQKFRQKVREFYAPFYKDGDEAHLINHADDVCDLALEINKECNEKLIILSAYIHDIFNAKDRKNHNKLAYNYVLEAKDSLLQNLTNKERLLVAHAVLEHRASYKGEYFSKLSKIISSADRGKPDIKAVVIRSMKYNHADAQNVYKHIKDKYARNGYAKYPDIYKELFGKELKKFKSDADNITVEKILKIWEDR